ncbi:MAG: elongation factor 4 [Candidatus Sungbacteria bacterium]|nr:elongation factor 4 [Candidatus Sungbacteria bacterium]
MTQVIRNFCILAHIDHGKSTLADRLLELTGTVEKRKMHAQYLDQMELEQEKGITIKMQPVRMRWNSGNTEFILNLIDTPGHVDFTYEVSRALAAVEGAILLVDATQGVQAQTIANLHLAEQEGLAIIPVINKIDLPSAEIEKAEEELETLLAISRDSILKVSAKDGTGVENLLRHLAERVPPPKSADPDARLRALIFDSQYDPYQGVVAHVRVIDGTVRAGGKIEFMASDAECEAMEVGVFLPGRISSEVLGPGEIGYIATGIKEPEQVRVGDTITSLTFKGGDRPTGDIEPLSGYREPNPVVFASVFPENQDDYEALRESLKKLKLNDAALSFEPEQSGALGRGFRTGFLGMLHMEIISERLQREYGLKLIFSNPSVSFRVRARDGKEEVIYSAAKLPSAHEVESLEEPWVLVEVVTPERFLGILTTLVSDREGYIVETSSVSGGRLLIKFEAPLREIVVDFYDTLKSVSQGFASMAYEWLGWRKGDLVRLDILVAGEKVSSFSEIVPREKVYYIARERVAKLKELLPRELFQISLQAETDGRIIARETITALKKDVTGYMYGGDRTRKMKLWKKQQRGKERLKSMGRVEIPPDVFLKMLKKT